MNQLSPQVETWPVSRLKPYEHNPRSHTETSVAKIANSIARFGFRNPILVDKDGVIVMGHGRRLAAIQLKRENVPVIVAPDLTEDEANALRLADNRTAEGSRWKSNELGIELAKLQGKFDLHLLGFDLDEIADLNLDNQGKVADTFAAAPQTLNGILQLSALNRYPSPPPWNIPEFRPDMLMALPEATIKVWAGQYLDKVPDDEWRFWVWGSDSLKDCPRDRTICAFYADDDKFNCFFDAPDVYTAKLLNLGIRCAVSPNYSLWNDDAGAERLHNTFKARCIGRYFQEAGIRLIPDVNWGGPDTYDYCFLGLPVDAPVISVQLQTMGPRHEIEQNRSGLGEALRRLEPRHLLVYGGDVARRFMNEFDTGGIPWTFIANRSTLRHELLEKKPVMTKGRAAAAKARKERRQKEKAA